MSDTNSDFGDNDLFSEGLAEHFGQQNADLTDQSTNTENVPTRESSTQTVESITPEISTDSSEFVEISTDVYSIRRPKRRSLSEPTPPIKEQSPIDAGFIGGSARVSPFMDVRYCLVHSYISPVNSFFCRNFFRTYPPQVK